jgi:cell wall-associated NlpC family hydrolase
VAAHDHRAPLCAGDLLFFTHADGRIGHVGISLGGWKVIHAEEPAVTTFSLCESDPDYSQDRTHHFVMAKRYLTGIDGRCP